MSHGNTHKLQSVVRADFARASNLTTSLLSGTIAHIMLMIRFQRIGRRNDAAFRMAVLEKASGPKAGKYVDLVGTYNPKTKAMTVKEEAIKGWVAKGAQVSPSLMNLLIKNNVLEGKKVAVISKTNLEKNIAKKKAEDEAAEAKLAAEQAKEAEAKAAADAKAAEEAAAAAETPVEAPVAEVETPVETPAVEEASTEAPAEDVAPEAAPEEEVVA